jgi:aspartyl-tRNA(Asn)/glutamyl-tRNA(Gln) amidotransferase subunit C
MATSEDVQKLAALARIKVSEAELAKFTAEFDAILAYVGKLDELSLGTDAARGGKPALRNVFREDANPNVAGANTEKLAAAFPARESDALSVKQIITHD